MLKIIKPSMIQPMQSPENRPAAALVAAKRLQLEPKRRWPSRFITAVGTLVTLAQAGAADLDPRLVGSYGNSAWGVAVSGTRAYLAGSGQHLDSVEIVE